MSVDNAGNVYVIGKSAGASTGLDYATIKYTASGTAVWERRYTTQGVYNDEPSAIALDASGNVFVNTWSCDNFANDIAVDAIGNIYIAGGTERVSCVSDKLLTKYSTAGIKLWKVILEAEYAHYEVAKRIVLDNLGNVYLTAQSFHAASSGTTNDYLTLKYSPDDGQLWSVWFNSSSNLNDIPSAIAVVNPTTASQNPVVYVTGNNNNDIYTVKYSQPATRGAASVLDSLTNSVTGQEQFRVRNYPNPFHTHTNIVYELPVSGRVNLSVYDVMGRKIATLVDGYRTAGTHVERFTGGDLAEGVYHYQYMVDTGKEILKENKMMIIRK